MDLNFSGTKLLRIENFCVFRFFIFVDARPTILYYMYRLYICTIMCFAYKPYNEACLGCGKSRSSNDAVPRYSALRTCPSSYNHSYSAHSNFLCKVCVSVNYRSELRRCAKVVISNIAQRMFEVESCICGIHVYGAVWKPRIGEILSSHFVEL